MSPSAFGSVRALRTTPMRSSSSSSSSSAAGAVAMENVVSSCTWRQRPTSNGGTCELAPRSCYSCLNTKPTSGESCTLTPEGVCMGVAAYDATRDYRRMGPASAWPPHLNFFPAENATYCEPNDTACASCRDQSFQNWQANPSQYCEGYKGCVCVAVCENDQWRDAIEPALERALAAAQANGSYTNCSIEEPVVQEDNATVVSNLTDFVGLGSTKDIYAATDQCRWVQNQTYCGAPRSCYDCLNTPLYSGVKCMLHSSGYCTTMTSYDPHKDFRHEGRSNNSIALFPATNTTYCSPNDLTCARCRDSLEFAIWSGAASPPKFCTGAKGCVCLASCESYLWQSSVVALTCNTSAVQQLTKNDQAKAYQLSPVAYWSVSALSLVMAMVLALLGLSCLRRCQQHRAVRRQRPRSPRGPTLELSGWKAMREKLIETEREFVGEIGGITHLESRRRRSSSAGSAEPDSEPRSPRSSLDAPALMVEEGDAYRPVSPSRMRS